MIKEKTSQITNWLVTLFFLSLPFERLLAFEAFGYTVKISYVLAVLLIINFVISRSQTHPKPTSKFWNTVKSEEAVLLIFNALAFLSIIWSIDQKRSIVISSLFLLMSLVFIVLRRLVNDQNRNKIEHLWIIIGTLTSLFAIWQFIVANIPVFDNYSFLRLQYQSQVFGFPRAQSTFLEPLYFANFLIIPLFLAIKAVLNKLKLNYTIALLLMGIGIFLTLSRGAFYAILISLLILMIYVIIARRQWLTNFVKCCGVLMLSVILGTLLIYSTAGQKGVVNYYGHAAINDIQSGESVIDRASTMKTAFETSLEKPLGVGAGAFGALSQYRGNIDSRGYQTVNNLYLEILVEEGILGLALFSAFLILILIYLIRQVAFSDSKIPFESKSPRILNNSSDCPPLGGAGSNNNLSAIFYLVAILALFIQYLSFSTLYIIYIWAFLALIWPVKKPINF